MPGVPRAFLFRCDPQHPIADGNGLRHIGGDLPRTLPPPWIVRRPLREFQFRPGEFLGKRQDPIRGHRLGLRLQNLGERNQGQSDGIQFQHSNSLTH